MIDKLWRASMDVGKLCQWQLLCYNLPTCLEVLVFKNMLFIFSFSKWFVLTFSFSSVSCASVAVSVRERRRRTERKPLAIFVIFKLQYFQGEYLDLRSAIFPTRMSWSQFCNISDRNILTIVQGEEPIGHWSGLEKDREGNGLDRGPDQSVWKATRPKPTIWQHCYILYFELTNACTVFSLYFGAAKCRPAVKITAIHLLSEQK